MDEATGIPAGKFAATVAAFRHVAMRLKNADHQRSLFDRGLQPIMSFITQQSSERLNQEDLDT